MRQEERNLLQQIKELATFTSWRIYHTHDSRKSDKGFPDVVLLKPPQLIFAELKAPDGIVTPEQHEWLVDLGAVRDIEVNEWRPDDWDRIVKRLTKKPVRS